MITRCESDTCKRKNRYRRPVWMIDGRPYCNPCYEAWIDGHFVDEHRVHRLSENELDFESFFRPAARNHSRA